MSGSGNPSGSSSTPGAGSSSTAPKAISSLAKRPSDTTRQGAQKLKFVPTLPQKKKKPEAKPEPTSATVPPTTDVTRGRGRGSSDGRARGRGDASGRGRGRGDARPAVEMTASGPFAMGPALAGNNGRRVAPRSNIAIPTSFGSTPGSSLDASSSASVKQDSNTDGTSKWKGKGKEKSELSDEQEVYSDPDEGVEIIDMDNVRETDWLAPESLKREKKRTSKLKKIKIEEFTDSKAALGDVVMDAKEAAAKGEVDLANAIDLEESEEEEEMEDIIDDFSFFTQAQEDPDIRQERLYLFQFPNPFPTFAPSASAVAAAAAATQAKQESSGKKVTFSSDTKPPASTSEAEAVLPAVEPRVDGIIGNLEIYESGAVKLRLANGILLDVKAATQPAFYQHAVRVDPEQKQLTVVGEVNKRFVVSPDVESLLAAMEIEENKPVTIEGEDELIAMDTT